MISVGVAVPRTSSDDHFVAALVNALGDSIVDAGMGLITSFVPDAAAEERIHRRWAESGTVAGIVLLGVRPQDPRVLLLRRLGMPFAAVVDTDDVVDFPAVVIDAAASITALSTFIASRGDGRVIYITGPDKTVGETGRAAAMEKHFEVLRIDPAADSVEDATATALATSPSTLVFDSDAHAVAALATLTGRGVRIPEDLAMISWTDSTLCQSTAPSITAINRRGSEIGEMLASQILSTIAGGSPVLEYAPHPFMVARESA